MSLEATSDLLPALDEVRGVFRLVEHVHLPVACFPARRHVKVYCDFDSVLCRERQHSRVEMVKLGVKPLVVVLQVAICVVEVPKAVHLVSDQLHTPSVQLYKIVFSHRTGRGHDAAQLRHVGDSRRVSALARFVDLFSWCCGGGDP